MWRGNPHQVLGLWLWTSLSIKLKIKSLLFIDYSVGDVLLKQYKMEERQARTPALRLTMLPCYFFVYSRILHLYLFFLLTFLKDTLCYLFLFRTFLSSFQLIKHTEHTQLLLNILLILFISLSIKTKYHP